MARTHAGDTSKHARPRAERSVRNQVIIAHLSTGDSSPMCDTTGRSAPVVSAAVLARLRLPMSRAGLRHARTSHERARTRQRKWNRLALSRGGCQRYFIFIRFFFNYYYFFCFFFSKSGVNDEKLQGRSRPTGRGVGLRGL